MAGSGGDGSNFMSRPDGREHWPVRVRAGAFGVGLPRRDLMLSPDHAVFVDGALVPVRHLADGAAIAHEFVTATTSFSTSSWHEATTSSWRKVYRANHISMPATGMNSRPVRHSAAPFPPTHANRVAWAWQALGCAELVTSGPRVEAIRQRLPATETRTTATA